MCASLSSWITFCHTSLEMKNGDPKKMMTDVPTTPESFCVEITNENITSFNSRVLFTLRSFHKVAQPGLLGGNVEAVTWSYA